MSNLVIHNRKVSDSELWISWKWSKTTWF